MARATPKQIKLIEEARAQSSGLVTEAMVRRVHAIRMETIGGFAEASRQAVQEANDSRLIDRMVVGMLGGMRTGSIHTVQ